MCWPLQACSARGLRGPGPRALAGPGGAPREPAGGVRGPGWGTVTVGRGPEGTIVVSSSQG